MLYYLQHHGIKGQKWGVRRYQNDDGSLTEAGKARMKKEKKANDHPNETTQSLSNARQSAERGKRMVNAMAAVLIFDHFFGDDVAVKIASATKNAIKETVSRKMAEKAVRDATVKLAARKLRRVAGDVYEWV